LEFNVPFSTDMAIGLSKTRVLAVKISNFYTSKMADGRHLEKSKNGHIFAKI